MKKACLSVRVNRALVSVHCILLGYRKAEMARDNLLKKTATTLYKQVEESVNELAAALRLEYNDIVYLVTKFEEGRKDFVRDRLEVQITTTNTAYS